MFVARTVAADGVPRKYQVWLPAAYDDAQKWPAILFLHGAGERGSDGRKQSTVGLGRPLSSGTLDPPAIIVFPQCPAGERWIGAALNIAMAALDASEREFSIDRKRVSLTGISMGGAGSWALAADHPERWSALAPICAYVHRSESIEQLAKRLPPIPIWIFHGSDDPIVPVSESREMARALGRRADYTEFTNVGHNAWDPAYTETHLVQWLTEQRRR